MAGHPRPAPVAPHPPSARRPRGLARGVLPVNAEDLADGTIGSLMSTENPPPKRLPIARVLVGIVAVVALAALGRQFGVFLDRFVEWVEGLGALGPVAFILGYVAATVAFVPGAVLTLAAGAVFGLGQGVVYVMIGATAGASVAFLLARSVAREAIAQRVAGNPRFAAIDRAVGREGFKIVVLLRLSPVFPFNMLNYGLGLTNVRFVDYAAASIGMLPGSLLYTYSGFVAGDIVRLAGNVGPERGPGYYAVVALGLAATVAVATIVTRTARRAIREATGETEAETG